jgi:hypothetical protein
MGNLDRAADTRFKTDQDGRKLYFHGYPLREAYIIPTEAEYQRLRQHVKAVDVGLMIWPLILGSLLQLLNLLNVDVIAIIIFIFLPVYLQAGWMVIQCRHLQRADKKFSGEKLSTLDLWIIEILSLGLVMGGMAGIYYCYIHWCNWQTTLILGLFIVTEIFVVTVQPMT